MRPGRGGGGVTVELAGGGGRPGLWRTPTPYLFLGFAFMMGLIVLALLVLVCARRKPPASPSGSSRREAADEKASSAARALVPLDREPRVVVVMAGDALPSFLASAKPLASADAPEQGAAAV